MNIIEKKVSELIPNPKNPRQIGKSDFDKLVTSITNLPEMLWFRPLLIDSDNVVIAGNMRLKACTHIGMESVPTIDVSKLSKKKREELLIKDNISFGNWDWDILANEWDNQDLQDWGMPVWDLDLHHIDNTTYDKEDDTPLLGKATDKEHALFELVMRIENKKALMEKLNLVKDEYNLDTMEEALMKIINTYE